MLDAAETVYSDFRGGFWSEISFYPIYNGDLIIGAACFSHDISWRKKAEKEITDYKNALDQSSILSIIDKERRIKYVNDNFCIISGYSKSELLDHDHSIFDTVYHTPAMKKEILSTTSNGR